MTIWEQLGIEKTRDKRKIKHAYAKQAAKYHPEEHPEEFKELYEAYQSALSYAARPGLDEDTDALILEELINEKSSPYSPERKEENTIDFSAFNKSADATILEELINATSSSQPPRREEEEITVDFSAFDIEADVPVEDPDEMRLIDGVIRNMQVIIEHPEKNILWKSAKVFLGRGFDRRMKEWRILLQSSGFQKIRKTRGFILRLNKLQCISLLPSDMAQYLYNKLDFSFIEKSFERADYRELQFRLQQCIERDVKRRQVAERGEAHTSITGLAIFFVLFGVCVVGTHWFEIADSRLAEKQVAEIKTQLQKKYHQEFEVDRSGSVPDWQYDYLSESLDTSEYDWFYAVALEGNMAGRKCAVSWKSEEEIRDSFAYELVEQYRQECDAVNQFQCKKRWNGGRQHCSYQYKEDGIIYNYPIYDVWYSYKKKRVYSIEEIQQLKEWIHKIQDEDMLFVHTPYIKLLFRGLHGEEYVLKLTQDYNEVDYHKLIRKLEQFRWEGKKKKKGK